MTEEIFSCDCGSLEHVFQLIHFPPVLNEDEEDSKIIYLTLFVNQWRRGLVPRLGWKDIFDIKSCYCPFTKELYKDFYYSSTYKRWIIAFRYLFNCEYKNDFTILDSSFISETKKLDRLYDILSNLNKYMEEEIDKNIECCELESDTYKLHIIVDREIKDLPNQFTLLFRFKPKKGLKKLWQTIKYGFGGYLTNYGNTDCYNIKPKDAAIMKNMIKIIKEENDARE